MTIKDCFNNVVRIFTHGNLHISTWLVSKYNYGKVAFANNNHVVTPVSSSIYGVLISGDTARHWL